MSPSPDRGRLTQEASRGGCIPCEGSSFTNPRLRSHLQMAIGCKEAFEQMYAVEGAEDNFPPRPFCNNRETVATIVR